MVRTCSPSVHKQSAADCRRDISEEVLYVSFIRSFVSPFVYHSANSLATFVHKELDSFLLGI